MGGSDDGVHGGWGHIMGWMRIKNLPTLIAASVIITLIFSPAIIYPFFQDVFFALVTTRVGSLTDVLSLFKLIPEAVYWRPLGIQLYFGLMQFLGLIEPIWFHLTSLAFHLFNTYLVYRLVLRDCHGHQGDLAMTKRNERVAKLTAFLWGISPIHYFALGWAVNFSFILVVTWSILAVMAAGEGKNWRAMLFLILGLGTNELAVVIPGLAVLAAGRKRLKLLISMTVIVAIYLIWRMASGIKIQGDYVLGLTTVLSTLRWYGLWMLGWSDIVRDFIRWGAVFTGDFIKTFPAVVSIYLVEIGVLISTGLPRLPAGEAGRYAPRNDRLLWVIIGLLPVLFFQKHLYSHYGAIAAIGFYWWLAEIAVRRGGEMLIAIVWIMVVLATMGLNYKVSWMADHAANSSRFQKMVQEQMPEERVSRIYIVSDGLKARTVLLGGYGVEYLTGVSRDKVIFVNSEDEIPEPKSDAAIINL